MAVFVDGDFWHGNPAEWKRRGYKSMDDQFQESKRAWWTQKLQRNIERDREVTATLEADGWIVLRIWESEVLADVAAAAERVAGAWSAVRGG